MAKYEDYVSENTEQGELEKEIDESKQNKQQRMENEEFEMPERFKGKSSEEIARSYVELEKHSSRRESELDRTRRLADELISIESQRAQQQNTGEEESPEPISADELYDNPEEAISKVVERSITPKLEGLEQKLSENDVRDKITKFSQKFPQWEEDAQKEDFSTFVQGSEYRKRLAQKADQYDLEAAEELFGIYYDLRDHAAGVGNQERNQALEAGQLESGGPTQYEREEIYKRSDLLEKRVASAKGDYEATKWLQEHAEDIAIAYEEGRVKD